MSKLTEILGLFCYDPETDGANTFNIPKALNENWEKIDQLVLLAVAAAAAYDPEGSYAVGDYCTHGGKLHKCNTPIPSGEAWNAEHWTETTVAAELEGKANATPPEEYDLPFADGFSNAYDAYPSKYSKTQEGLVIVIMNLKADALSSGTVVATLPLEFRPAYNLSFVAKSGTYSTSAANIYTNGNISINGRFEAGDTQFSFVGLFIAAQ